MKVYIVILSSYDEPWSMLIAVFSSKHKANIFVQRCKLQNKDTSVAYDVVEKRLIA